MFMRVMCWVFVVIGIGFAIGGIFIWRQDQKFLASAVQTQGVVVDYSRSESTDSSTNRTSVSYQRVVQYTANHADYRKSESGGSSSVPRIGEKVTVYYDPKNPGDGMIDSFGRLHMGLICLGAGALWTLLWGAVLFWGDKLF